VKRVSILMILCSLPTVQAQPLGLYQHGTVVRMRTGECLSAAHGFMGNFGAPQGPIIADSCPEYTLVSEKVVFVIVGRSSNQVIPLADIIDFRVQKNEIAVRLNDAKRESKFTIKEMILRPQWERLQRHINDELDSPFRTPEGFLIMRDEN
jgi:hypothetical protein